MSVVKIVNGGMNVRIENSVGWNVHRVIIDLVLRGFDGEVNMSNMESIWLLMLVYI